MSNVDHTKMREYVDRWVEFEREFINAKNEHTDMIKDMKTEIKSRSESTGIDVKEVQRQVKIRLEEQAMKDKAAELEADLALYALLYTSGGDPEDPLS